MFDYDEICKLHYDETVPHTHLTSMVSEGFDFILNSVSFAQNITTSKEISKVRGEMFEHFSTNLDLADQNFTGIEDDKTKRGDECDWKKVLTCAAYTAGITACLALYAFGPIPGAEATICIIGLGPGALECYSSCF